MIDLMRIHPKLGIDFLTARKRGKERKEIVYSSEIQLSYDTSISALPRAGSIYHARSILSGNKIKMKIIFVPGIRFPFPTG